MPSEKEGCFFARKFWIRALNICACDVCVLKIV